MDLQLKIYFFGALKNGFATYPSHSLFARHDVKHDKNEPWRFSVIKQGNKIYYEYIRQGVRTYTEEGRKGGRLGIALEVTNAYAKDFTKIKEALDKIYAWLLSEQKLICKLANEEIAFVPIRLDHIQDYLDKRSSNFIKFIKGEYQQYFEEFSPKTIPSANPKAIYKNSYLSPDSTEKEFLALLNQYGTVTFLPQLKKKAPPVNVERRNDLSLKEKELEAKERKLKAKERELRKRENRLSREKEDTSEYKQINTNFSLIKTKNGFVWTKNAGAFEEYYTRRNSFVFNKKKFITILAEYIFDNKNKRNEYFITVQKYFNNNKQALIDYITSKNVSSNWNSIENNFDKGDWENWSDGNNVLICPPTVTAPISRIDWKKVLIILGSVLLSIPLIWGLFLLLNADPATPTSDPPITNEEPIVNIDNTEKDKEINSTKTKLENLCKELKSVAKENRKALVAKRDSLKKTLERLGDETEYPDCNISKPIAGDPKTHIEEKLSLSDCIANIETKGNNSRRVTNRGSSIIIKSDVFLENNKGKKIKNYMEFEKLLLNFLEKSNIIKEKYNGDSDSLKKDIEEHSSNNIKSIKNFIKDQLTKDTTITILDEKSNWDEAIGGKANNAGKIEGTKKGQFVIFVLDKNHKCIN